MYLTLEFTEEGWAARTATAMEAFAAAPTKKDPRCVSEQVGEGVRWRHSCVASSG